MEKDRIKREMMRGKERKRRIKREIMRGEDTEGYEGKGEERTRKKRRDGEGSENEGK